MQQSHQHVLEPELRSNKGAHDFAQHLLTKAAERLRRVDYYCRRLGVHLSWIGDLGGFWEETDFHETWDTGFLLTRLDEVWRRVPRYKPLSVGVVLLDLTFWPTKSSPRRKIMVIPRQRGPWRRLTCPEPGQKFPKI